MSRNALLDLHPDECRRPKRSEGVRKDFGQLAMAFDRTVLETPTRLLRGLVRGSDGMESQGAAVVVLPRLTAIQGFVVAVLEDHPAGLTAKEMERFPLFAGYSPSTVRKRVSELANMDPPKIEQVGRRDGCAVWRLK